jgi:hypothetical protein
MVKLRKMKKIHHWRTLQKAVKLGINEHEKQKMLISKSIPKKVMILCMLTAY